MSLRDWFAGQALAALPVGVELVDAEGMAEEAYAIADAMLAARHAPR
jgi:malonyl CoA-acyl carrier protein transacylase